MQHNSSSVYEIIYYTFIAHGIVLPTETNWDQSQFKSIQP